MNTEQIMKLVENYASDSSDILAEYDALHTAIEALVQERDANARLFLKILRP